MTSRRILAAAAAALTLSLGACSTAELGTAEPAAGLQITDLAEGQGPALNRGQTAVVHYTGWLTDGKKFDSSRDRREPFSFKVGAGSVIGGWELGVVGMKVGGKRKLVIPPELGYGERGAGDDIPPRATLVFEIELLEIR